MVTTLLEDCGASEAIDANEALVGEQRLVNPTSDVAVRSVLPGTRLSRPGPFESRLSVASKNQGRPLRPPQLNHRLPADLINFELVPVFLLESAMRRHDFPTAASFVTIGASASRMRTIASSGT